MRKRQIRIDETTLEVPEIPQDAPLLESRHQLRTNARMPRKKVAIELDVDIIAWFESEARRGGQGYKDHINRALRQYIIDLIGDKPVSATASLNEKQRQEVQKLIEETLSKRGFFQRTAI